MMIKSILTAKDPINLDNIQYSEHNSSTEVLQAYLRSIGLEISNEDLPDDGDI